MTPRISKVEERKKKRRGVPIEGAGWSWSYMGSGLLSDVVFQPIATKNKRRNQLGLAFVFGLSLLSPLLTDQLIK